MGAIVVSASNMIYKAGRERDLPPRLKPRLLTFERQTRSLVRRARLSIEPGVIGRWDRVALEQITMNLMSKPGFGLGLWITRQLLVAHQGEITVESQPGVGLVFTASLPRAIHEPPR
jgi:signal transduction histidine kinase